MSDGLPSIDDIIRAITRAVEGVIDDILGGVPDYLRGLVDRALDSVDGAIRQIAGSVDTAIKSAERSVDSAIKSAEQVANRAIDAAAGVANNAIDRAADSVDNAIDQAAGIVLTGIDRAADSVDNVVGVADRRLGQAIDRAADSVDNAIDGAVGVAITGISKAANTVDNVVGVADRRIGQAIEAGERSLNTIATNVRAGLENAGKAIENAVNNTLDFARDGFDKTLGAVGRQVGDAITRASNFVGDSLRAARDFISDIGQRISGGIESALGLLAAAEEAARLAIGQMYNDTIAYVEELWRRLQTYVEGQFNQGWEFVSENWQEWLTKIETNANTLAGGVESIGTKLFTCGYSSFSEVIGDFSALGFDSSLIKVLMLGVLAAGVVMGGAGQAAAPYLQCIANIGMADIRPMSADLGTLSAAQFRGLPGGDSFAEAAARQGVPDGHAAAYLATARNPAPVGAIVEALLRGIIDAGTASAQMVDAQYDPALLNQFVENARPLLSAADAFVAARRGGWSQEAAQQEAARAGWTAERQAAIQRLTDQLLTADQYVSLWLREELDEPGLDALLNERGYPERERGLIKQLAFFVPPPSDLIRMSLKDVWNQEIVDTFGLNEDLPEEFIKYARYQGISEFWARKYWHMAWDYPSNTQGFEMFQRGFITQEELELLLKTNDVPPFWRDRLIKINYNPLTRVDVRRMYQLGVLDEAAVTRAYLDIGYSPEDAQRLTEFTKRYTEDQAKSEQDELKSLSRVQIEQAYIRGIFSEAAAIAALKDLRYDERDAQLLLQLASARVSNDDAAKRYQQHNERIIRLITAAYADRSLTSVAAKEMLTEVGLDGNEAQRELGLAEMEADITLRAEMIDGIERMYERRIVDHTTVQQWLKTMNVPSQEASRLVEKWGVGLEFRADQPTRSDLRRWVRNGMITLDEYGEELRGLGYAEKYVLLYMAEDAA